MLNYLGFHKCNTFVLSPIYRLSTALTALLIREANNAGICPQTAVEPFMTRQLAFVVKRQCLSEPVGERAIPLKRCPRNLRITDDLSMAFSSTNWLSCDVCHALCERFKACILATIDGRRASERLVFGASK